MDYGTSVARRTRCAAPGWRHPSRNTTAASSYDAGVGTGPTSLSADSADSDCDVACNGSDPLPLTSPESLRNRAISGAELRTVYQRCGQWIEWTLR